MPTDGVMLQWFFHALNSPLLVIPTFASAEPGSGLFRIVSHQLMNDPSQPLTPKQTLLLILLPLLGTVISLRLWLHLVRVQHVYPGGYLVHHLFTGVLLVIPAAFVLAFGARHRWSAILARLVLGCGSGLILDEVVFLVMTKASDDDYVSRVSLSGAIGFIAGAVVLLGVLYRSRR